MLNTMIVVKMKKTNFSEWKKLFDGDAEMRAKFMRDALVGKVAAISGVRVDRLVIASIPYMISLIIALIAITYIPILTLYLPEHLLN